MLFLLALPTITVLIKNYTDRFGRELRKVDVAKDSILITGANSGIGFHAAKTMNALGFTVFAGVRKLSKADELIKQAKNPDKIIPIELDLTNHDHVQSTAKKIEEIVGENGLTAVFLAAGYMPPPTRFEEFQIETIRKVMEIEFFASVELTRALLPLVEKAEGRIVFNSDCNPSGEAFMTGLWPALWATCAFANGLNKELGKTGRMAKAIIMSPGPVFTPGVGTFLKDIPEPNDVMHPVYAQFVELFQNQGNDPATTTSADLAHAVLSKNPYEKYYPSGAYIGYVFGHMLYSDWSHWLEENFVSKTVDMKYVPALIDACDKNYDVQLDFMHTEL